MNIDKLAFMQGSWEADRGNGISEETWMPPKGGTMFGVNRTLRDGRTTFREFLQIEEKEGRVSLTISQKLGGPAITLIAGKMTESEVVFEPLDDPNKATVTYRSVGKDLHATVAGIREEKPYKLEFVFKRKT